MMKLSIVLLVAALAYSVNADENDDQQLGTSSALPSQPEFPAFPEGFPKGFPDFKIPSAEEIKKLKPHQPGEHVEGQFSSRSTSFKVVNGEVVENKEKAESVVNHDGIVTDFKEDSSSN